MGSNPTKLCHMTCHKVGIITFIQLFGRGHGFLKFGMAKTSKIQHNLGQLSNLNANISGIGRDIEKLKTNLIDIDSWRI